MIQTFLQDIGTLIEREIFIVLSVNSRKIIVGEDISIREFLLNP